MIKITKGNPEKLSGEVMIYSKLVEDIVVNLVRSMPNVYGSGSPPADEFISEVIKEEFMLVAMLQQTH